MHEEAIKMLKFEIEGLTGSLRFDEAFSKSTGIEPKSKEEVLKQVASLKHSLDYLELHAAGELHGLIDSILLWGRDRGIIGPEGKATVETQFAKLLEEVRETAEAIAAGDQAAVMDGIGDMTVVNILLADLSGLEFITCLKSAYDIIKNRTGKIIDGQFVKDQ
jgi:NTP pyrophosphatase (non-canonical NTP hydrolase)